jgi:hypothetical protein
MNRECLVVEHEELSIGHQTRPHRDTIKDSETLSAV